MNDWLEQVKSSWNHTSDSDWYQSLRTDQKIGELIKEPESAFHPDVFRLIKKYIPDLRSKKVLLPSSGDNHAAFALSLMGANVTSSDISEKQLEHAQDISKKLKLDICFICDDTMRLSNIEDNSFDFVYTSNGTHTWIKDLESMYKNIYRVLKPTGISIMYDIHPFNRPFSGDPWKTPEIIKSYYDLTPRLHWRVQDLVNAMANARFSIKEMAELKAVNASFWFSYDELLKQDEKKIEKINDWKFNPMAALPAWISIVAQKS